MKKIVCVLILVCLAVMLKSETVKITSGSWEPYTSSSMENNGNGLEAISAAFKAVGIDVEYGFFPWKRTMLNAHKVDSWDASATWYWSKEREQEFYFSDPIFDTKNVVFYLKDKSIDFDGTPKSLEKFKTGITLGYSYGEKFDAAFKSGAVKSEAVSTDLMNFKKLLKGRIDVFLCSFQVGYQTIGSSLDKTDQLKITNHPKAFKKSPLHLIISKKMDKSRADHILGKFNEGLKIFKNSERYKELFGE